ncbi:MAG: 1-acyl-sn-glycerol-3-phosphate acyltransferase [Cyclobacteriaceae bacterium]
MRQLSKPFFKFCFWLLGWKVVGNRPDVKKYVLIVAPHTSNWDFFVGLCARSISDLQSRFLIKDSITKIPIVGSIIYALGGRGVDRSRKTHLVDQVVELFDKEEEFVMTIAPEGTRSYNPDWKTGFYRIAMNANVPIQLVSFDFRKRIVEYGKLMYPSGNVETEIEEIKNHYKTVIGRNADKGVR